jgi:GT2 family glycosyltransferase
MGVLNRIRISPEGHSLAEAKILTRTLMRAGQRVFAISYHSPSLVPGKTPYTRTRRDVERFLSWIEGYLEFFIGELGGNPSTPGQVLELARKHGAAGIGSSGKQERYVARAPLSRSGPAAGLETAQPSVCVVIPAYNSEATIRRALDSVAAQTFPPARILVVDDASADATAKIAQAYSGAKVEVITLAENLGAAGARNVGIRRAETDLVAFLDADDEWLPTKLEKQVELIVTEPLSTFVSCGSDLISPTGKNLGNIYRGQTVTAGDNAWKALLENNYVTTPSVVVWRRHLEELGGFDQSLKIAEDQDMWIRLAERGRLSYVFENLVHVHERESSLSGGSFNDQLMYTLPMIEGHIARLSQGLTPQEIKSIRGRRILRLGQLAYSRGAPDIGRQLITRSIKMGYEPLECILFLAKASSFAIWLKKNFLRR